MGASGAVRGKTKDECWQNFVIERGKADKLNLVDYPKTKAEAYEHMKQDPITGEWVLEVFYPF